jgi:hypothetical protein
VAYGLASQGLSEHEEHEHPTSPSAFGFISPLLVTELLGLAERDLSQEGVTNGN